MNDGGVGHLMVPHPALRVSVASDIRHVVAEQPDRHGDVRLSPPPSHGWRLSR